MTAQLAHAITAGHAVAGLVPFLQVFFAIWWSWMNFTWFASSFDTDDVRYRLLTLLQMSGVLVLASGVPRAVMDGNFRIVTVGYLVMRVGLVALWLRAAREDPASRATARRYALGITVAEVGWITRLLLDEAGLLPAAVARPVFVVLVLLELTVPPWAERLRPTTWHPHHIAERYSLFTILLLGESVLAASLGVNHALASSGLDPPFVTIAVSGLVVVFGLWWLYFLHPCSTGLVARRRESYRWGYGHYGVFVSLAALGGGLEVAVAHAARETAASALAVSSSVAIPIAGFMTFLWFVNAALRTNAVHPAVTASAVGVMLLVPLAAPFANPAAVIAAIALTIWLVVLVTLLRPPARATAAT